MTEDAELSMRGVARTERHHCAAAYVNFELNYIFVWCV